MLFRSALVDFIVTFQTKGGGHVVISLDATPLAMAPVSVCRLHHLARTTVLTIERCHGFEELGASDVVVFLDH